MSYYMSLHTIYAWNVWGGIREQIVRFLTSKLASRFDGRSQAPASWPRWVSVGQKKMAMIVIMTPIVPILQCDIRHHPGWLPYLTVGSAAERGSVHGFWSLWRRRSVKVCTAFPFTFSFPQSCDWFCKILFLVFSRMVGGDVTVAWMDHKYSIFILLAAMLAYLKEKDDADDDVD